MKFIIQANCEKYGILNAYFIIDKMYYLYIWICLKIVILRVTNPSNIKSTYEANTYSIIIFNQINI